MDKNTIAVSTYEKIAGTYTRKYFRDKSDLPFIDRFLGHLKPGSKVLDVGCGPGQFSKYISGKGFRVVGIDLSKEMLNIAKKKVPKVRFKLMDMRNLKFDDESFDGLLVAYSLIHIPSKDVVKNLKGFYRILKPEGYILIIAQRGKPDQFINEPFKPSEKMFINFFTKKILQKYLQKARFHVIFQEEVDSLDPNSLSNKIIYTIAKRY